MISDEPDKAGNPFQEMIDLLQTLKEKVKDDAELMWTYYDSPQEVRDELDSYINGLLKIDHSVLLIIGSLFYPTCDFQQMAIDSGWGNEYLAFAARYDAIFERLNSRL